MVDLSFAITQMAILLLVTIIGFAAAKRGYLDEHVKGKLTLLLLNVTLPCMILASAGSIDASQMGGQIGWTFVLGIAQFFLLLASGALCNLVLRTPRGERPLYLFMSVLTNTGFVGIPVIAALYGDQTVLLSSVFIMAMNLLIYSVGFALIAPRGTKTGQSPWKAMANPATVASLGAIGLLLAGVRLPAVIEGTLDMVGGITAPVAMLLVGVIVANMPLRDVATEWRLYPFIVVRQLLVPAALFLALRPLVPDSVVLGLFVIMFAMPVGSMASMFAGQFGRDQALPAKGTVLSTMASFAIIPALVVFMGTA